jgi:ubiquinone/menaquinone biosynthesis C-methylase UbiE
VPRVPQNTIATPSLDRVREAYETSYRTSTHADWDFLDTKEPLIRYLRDRRITIALKEALALTGRPPQDLTALVVCGGVGGEGTYLKNLGCRSVTVTDFSQHALEICRQRDPRLETRVADAEQHDLPDESFDLVLVQDGLHELRRPTIGLTEMLRLSRVITIVIEPYDGLVGRLFGTRWEAHGGVINYVFRWNRRLVRDVVCSFLRAPAVTTRVIRLWDHNVIVGRMARLAGRAAAGVAVARAIYFVLDTVFAGLGNMMVAIIVKGDRAGAASHAR